MPMRTRYNITLLYLLAIRFKMQKSIPRGNIMYMHYKGCHLLALMLLTC